MYRSDKYKCIEIVLEIDVNSISTFFVWLSFGSRHRTKDDVICFQNPLNIVFVLVQPTTGMWCGICEFGKFIMASMTAVVDQHDTVTRIVLVVVISTPASLCVSIYPTQ